MIRLYVLFIKSGNHPPYIIANIVGICIEFARQKSAGQRRERNEAEAKGSTPAQISLAWMLHKKDFIVPIPGSRKPERIQENLRAADVELKEDEYKKIEEELSKIQIHGNRTDQDIAKLRSMK